jgi:hypothetical protein
MKRDLELLDLEALLQNCMVVSLKNIEASSTTLLDLFNISSANGYSSTPNKDRHQLREKDERKSHKRCLTKIFCWQNHSRRLG